MIVAIRHCSVSRAEDVFPALSVLYFSLEWEKSLLGPRERNLPACRGEALRFGQGRMGRSFPLLNWAFHASLDLLQSSKPTKIRSSFLLSKVGKWWSCLGWELRAWGGRERLLQPDTGSLWSCSRLEQQPSLASLEVPAKASWAAQKSLFSPNTAPLPRQQTRLLTKSYPWSTESWPRCQSVVREAALWNECTKGCVLFFLGCI